MLIDWLKNNWIEIFGASAGLLYVFLSIKEKVWLWPIGLITSVVYIYVFYTSKFYADMGLQFYYVFISIYGWILWLGGKKNKQISCLKISKTPLKIVIYLIISTVLIFFAIGFVLINYTDSPVPYWDAFTTAASITATWMLAKKYIEHWIIWVIVDLTSSVLYLAKELYPTVVLFVVYTIMAVIGYYQWKKSISQVESL